MIVGPKSSGSNMVALARACSEGKVPAHLRCVVAPSFSSPAALNAREHGLAVIAEPPGENYGARLLDALKGTDYVCLAGYLRLLPPEVLRAFPDRILNVHPALLPAFGGKGMYGRHVHEAVLAAGCAESGCTVHLVDEAYDEGRILLQRRCPVLPGDTPETLAARVLEQEHLAYPEALGQVIANATEFSPHSESPSPSKMDLASATHSPAMRSFGIPLLRLCFWLLFLLLGPLKVRGKYRVPSKGGVLILSNHLADVDPIIVQVACARPIHFMAKSELFHGLLGRILRFYRAFPIKRGEPDRAAIKLTLALLQAGEAVCVFPEGELSEGGEILPLKPGIALIVRKAQTPVICVGIRNTNKVMPYGQTIPRPSWTTIPCEWGEPHQFASDASVEEVLGWTERQLRALTNQDA